ncbi:ATP-binding protein [uncultured Thiocystis sp.]|jgi:anti-sigma regulatory factor (Ser/Thr protein kinase)|uniref:ATP-binding protein n=1 Tax=uncultured Thiocystis sp. TaxID=1202134 RepID=UPI0025DE9073|nr:ATP-binding protein [uncultured Thiocystis sp.]
MTSARLRLSATLDNLLAARTFLKSLAEQAGLDPRLAGRLELALEEVFVNICHYAYPTGQPGEIELRVCPGSDRFVLDVLDDGQPFDPETQPEPVLSTTLEQRAIGGLGWFLTRQMVSELSCRREQGRNLTTLVIQQPAGQRPPPQGGGLSGH